MFWSCICHICLVEVRWTFIHCTMCHVYQGTLCVESETHVIWISCTVLSLLIAMKFSTCYPDGLSYWTRCSPDEGQTEQTTLCLKTRSSAVAERPCDASCHYIHRVQKKRCHWFFCCNFYKYWRIFIIFRAQLRKGMLKSLAQKFLAIHLLCSYHTVWKSQTQK